MTAQSKRYGKKTFTPAQIEQYKQKKEAEKEEIHALYKNFLTKKTIKDFVGIIAEYRQLHNYSIRNRFLVLAQAEQRHDDKFIGVLNSFFNWKEQDIQVLKGIKAYKVLVPIFAKKKNNNNEVISDNNQDQPEKSEKYLHFFKLGNVFDISQTSEYENYLKERKEIDQKIMKNAEIDYTTALDYTQTYFPEAKIKEIFKDQELKGTYNPLSKQIILYEQTSHNLFHELGHHITISIMEISKHSKKNYAKNEILAELVSYLLMKSFDENINYNFAYSNCWASKITESFEIEEFEKAFKSIYEFLHSQKYNTTIT